MIGQKFVASVFDAYAIRDNTAVLRCHVLANVRDFVKVISWTRQDGVTVGGLCDSVSVTERGLTYDMRSSGNSARHILLRLYDWM